MIKLNLEVISLKYFSKSKVERKINTKDSKGNATIYNLKLTTVTANSWKIMINR